MTWDSGLGWRYEFRTQYIHPAPKQWSFAVGLSFAHFILFIGSVGQYWRKHSEHSAPDVWGLCWK